MIVASLAVSSGGFAECPRWHYAGAAGKVKKKRVDEASGLAVSRQLPDVIWVHNDQPRDERVFGLNKRGELLAQLAVQVDSLDWEDLAVGPCGVAGRHCLYVADTGASRRRRKAVQVLRFWEPRFEPNPKRLFKMAIRRFEVAYFHYEDAAYRDAEALMVDASGTLWLFDKHEQRASLFRAKFERGLKPGAIFERVATRQDIGFVTGADLAADGSRFVVRNKKNAFEFLIRSGQDVAAAFRDSYEKIPLHEESQGEGIGYTADGRELFTVSEGKREPIHRYVRVPGCEPRG